MDTVMDRATLEGFVDGALSPEDSARVVLHLADCPQDRAFVDRLMELNALLAAAYEAPLHEPAPERLRAAIFPAAPGGALSRPQPQGWRRIVARGGARRGLLLALAASWAAVLGVALWPEATRGPAAPAGVVADATLDAALETRPSGEVAAAGEGAEILVIATFLDRDGRPCREFEVLDFEAEARTEGVACRDAAAADWTTEVVVASRLEAPADRGEAFVPAEGGVDRTLDLALDRLGAGMSLSPAEEQALIASDWRR